MPRCFLLRGPLFLKLRATKTTHLMKNAIRWFEIPTKDLARAKAFYQRIFGISLQDFQPNDRLQMALFPTDQDGVGGALCHNPEFYTPSTRGVLVYLNASPDLQKVLELVESSGGKVIQSRTQLSEEIGYMAIIEDSEANRIGLMAER